MAGRELDNKAEQTEARQASNFSSMLPELLQNGSHRQLSQVESSKTITNNGFPQLELVDGNTAMMKADSTLKFSSKYETDTELRTEDELKHVGLNRKDVKHTIEKQDSSDTKETSSVKYPNGLEVTVSGSTKHMPDGSDKAGKPETSIKEPMPKGFHKDQDGAIYDAGNKQVGQINDDGTVTMKVKDKYVTQGPAGVREETVFEHKDGSGMVGRMRVKEKTQ